MWLIFTFYLRLCLLEIEAKEACDWLRAAGFPQYAQLFEGNKSTQKNTHTPSSHGGNCSVKRYILKAEVAHRHQPSSITHFLLLIYSDI